MTENGITADQKATAILTSQVALCRHYAMLPQMLLP